MKSKLNRGNWILIVFIFLTVFSQLISVSIAAPLNRYGVESDNPYVTRRFVHGARFIDEVIVPGRPPENYQAQDAILFESSSAVGPNLLSNVPAFDWSYGCSATSAAMMFGYYDNTGYPNLYTGPTNGGVMPHDQCRMGPGGVSVKCYTSGT